MKKTTKLLTLTCCALVLVAISVGATLAYLKDDDAVVNTFTVGQVHITLDEADTDDSTPNKNRDQSNEYHLIPGETYPKDPTVHVTADSEDSWIFVKVENGLAAIETQETDKKIESQIVKHGWTKLDGYDNIYFKAHSKGDEDYVVFDEFTIDGASVTNDILARYDTDSNEAAKINVTAYAIQKPGFEPEYEETATEAEKAAATMTAAKEAWKAGKWN